MPPQQLLATLWKGLPRQEPLPVAENVLGGGGGRRGRAGNVWLLPHRSGFFHPDLVQAADAVVGKIGYSTLAETCRARIPYGFVPRAGFRESAVLGRWLIRNFA